MNAVISFLEKELIFKSLFDNFYMIHYVLLIYNDLIINSNLISPYKWLLLESEAFQLEVAGVDAPELHNLKKFEETDSVKVTDSVLSMFRVFL